MVHGMVDLSAHGEAHHGLQATNCWLPMTCTHADPCCGVARQLAVQLAYHSQALTMSVPCRAIHIFHCTCCSHVSHADWVAHFPMLLTCVHVGVNHALRCTCCLPLMAALSYDMQLLPCPCTSIMLHYSLFTCCLRAAV